MGKASSKKKVARAAKAGGSRARAAGERNIVFPSALALVVILGTLLVVYARDDRQADALEAPLAFDDHWHSAVGFFVCDTFQADLPEFTAPQNGGTHTHGDGLLHIHPFSTARSGSNATLQNWLDDAGTVLGNAGGLSDDALAIPGRTTFEEGSDECEGLDGDPIVQVAVWDTAASALSGNEADRIVTEDFDSVRFDSEGQAFTIAFAPEGTEIPPPATTADLSQVGSDLGLDPADVPAEADGSTGTEEVDAGDSGSEDSGSEDVGSEDVETPDTEPDAEPDADADAGTADDE